MTTTIRQLVGGKVKTGEISMNKKFRKVNVILATCGLLAASAVGVATLNADETIASAQSSVFEMKTGAAAKLNEDGLRYIVKMSEDVYNKAVTDDTTGAVDLYFIIAPHKFLADVQNEQYIEL